jgi:hypothetical protein
LLAKSFDAMTARTPDPLSCPYRNCEGRRARAYKRK